MRISERVQEQLELLWLATEEGEKPGLLLDDPSVQDVDELIRATLAERRGGWLILTASGTEEAARAIRRHRLAERLVTDVLMPPDPLLDEHACRLEHALYDSLDESICTLLGHPRFCPHGKPIPRGECCRQMRDRVEQLIRPLQELPAGRSGEIAYIQMNHPSRLQKLMAMGVLPGVPVSLLRHSPSIVFEAGYSQFAVDREIAADIYVRLKAAPEDSGQ